MTQIATPQTAALPSTELPLHDIHLPEPISWWPPAPGWWLLLALALLVVVAAVLLRRSRSRRRRQRRVFEQLDRLETAYAEHQNALQLVRELSVLMRRAGISFYPRRETAALTGDNWLAWLDSTSPHHNSQATGFSEGAGRLLASAPYANRIDADQRDVEALIALCRDWLQANSARPKPKKAVDRAVEVVTT